MDFLSEFISLPFVQFWLAAICVSGVLLVIVWTYILRRRSERRNAAKRAEANAALASLDAVPAPEAPEFSAEARNPVGDVGGALRGIGRSIRNFFFYSEEEKAALQASKQPANTAAPDSTPAVALPRVSPPPDTAEVLHLWRDVADGGLIIQIGDKTYRTMGELAAAGQERRFLAVLRELARIAKETSGEVSASTPAPASVQTGSPGSQETNAAPPVMTPGEPASAPAEEASPLPPSLQPEVESMVRAAQRIQGRPSLTADLEQRDTLGEDSESLGTFFGNVRNAVRRGGRTPEKKPEPPVLSIADHIEEFLQARLRTAPVELQDRRVHVRPALDGGVRIEVDGRFYEAVGDIEDETVRQFVIDAIQDWEAHH